MDYRSLERLHATPEMLAFVAMSLRTQEDKDHQPLLFHVMRVAARMMDRWGDAIHCGTVALFHDTIEAGAICTPNKAGRNGAGTLSINGQVPATIYLPGDEIHALIAITHLRSEPYQDYIRRVMSNPIATFVKIYDLDDNLDRRRFRRLPRDEQIRLKGKYKPARSLLLGATQNYYSHGWQPE